MFADNRIFDVNGDDEMLEPALKLAFLSAGMKLCEAYVHSEKFGLVLLWSSHEEGAVPLPSSMSAKECVSMVQAYLLSKKAQEVEREGDERDMDHDGDNTLGWRMRVARWGHVGASSFAICGIKSVCLWHGK
jgi:hypothetical protein